jgi:hypothetical protein
MLWILLAVTGSATTYYAAIVGGLFKNSLLAQFRKYGEEQRVYPICRLLNVAGATSLALAMLIPRLAAPFGYYRRLFPGAVFTLLALTLWGASLLVYQRPALREALPFWYFDLLRTASRQERRHIGYAWLRIPRAMRWRFNGDQQAFRVWAELVRLTVIYGAYDPESPWTIWT